MAKKIMVAGSTSLEIPEGGRIEDVALHVARIRCFQLYVAHDGVSLDYILNHYRLDENDPTSPMLNKCIGIKHIKAISERGGWPKKRSDVWARVEKMIENNMVEDITRERILEAQQLKITINVLYNNITGVPDPHNPGDFLIEPVRPKTLEGTARAMVSVMQQLEQVRVVVEPAVKARNTGAHVIDSTEIEPFVDDALDDAEIAILAHSLAKIRAKRAGKHKGDEE